MVMNYSSYDINLHMLNHYKRLHSAKNVVKTNSKKSRPKTTQSRENTSRKTNSVSSYSSRFSSPPSSNGNGTSQSSYASTQKYKKTSVTERRVSCQRNALKTTCPSTVLELSEDEKTDQYPMPTARTPETRKHSDNVPDYEYLQFSLRITEDIIRNDLYTNKEMQRVFSSHIEANRGRLTMTKMLVQIDVLCAELNLARKTSEQLNTNCKCPWRIHEYIKKLGNNSDDSQNTTTEKSSKYDLINKIITGTEIITDEEIKELNEKELQEVISELLISHDDRKAGLETMSLPKCICGDCTCKNKFKEVLQQSMTCGEVKETPTNGILGFQETHVRYPLCGYGSKYIDDDNEIKNQICTQNVKSPSQKIKWNMKASLDMKEKKQNIRTTQGNKEMSTQNGHLKDIQEDIAEGKITCQEQQIIPACGVESDDKNYDIPDTKEILDMKNKEDVTVNKPTSNFTCPVCKQRFCICDKPETCIEKRQRSSGVEETRANEALKTVTCQDPVIYKKIQSCNISNFKDKITNEKRSQKECDVCKKTSCICIPPNQCVLKRNSSVSNIPKNIPLSDDCDCEVANDTNLYENMLLDHQMTVEEVKDDNAATNEDNWFYKKDDQDTESVQTVGGFNSDEVLQLQDINLQPSNLSISSQQDLVSPCPPNPTTSFYINKFMNQCYPKMGVDVSIQTSFEYNQQIADMNEYTKETKSTTPTEKDIQEVEIHNETEEPIAQKICDEECLKSVGPCCCKFVNKLVCVEKTLDAIVPECWTSRPPCQSMSPKPTNPNACQHSSLGPCDILSATDSSCVICKQDLNNSLSNVSNLERTPLTKNFEVKPDFDPCKIAHVCSSPMVSRDIEQFNQNDVLSLQQNNVNKKKTVRIEDTKFYPYEVKCNLPTCLNMNQNRSIQSLLLGSSDTILKSAIKVSSSFSASGNSKKSVEFQSEFLNQNPKYKPISLETMPAHLRHTSKKSAQNKNGQNEKPKKFTKKAAQKCFFFPHYDKPKEQITCQNEPYDVEKPPPYVGYVFAKVNVDSLAQNIIYGSEEKKENDELTPVEKEIKNIRIEVADGMNGVGESVKKISSSLSDTEHLGIKGDLESSMNEVMSEILNESIFKKQQNEFIEIYNSDDQEKDINQKNVYKPQNKSTKDSNDSYYCLSTSPLYPLINIRDSIEIPVSKHVANTNIDIKIQQGQRTQKEKSENTVNNLIKNDKSETDSNDVICFCPNLELDPVLNRDSEEQTHSNLNTEFESTERNFDSTSNFSRRTNFSSEHYLSESQNHYSSQNTDEIISVESYEDCTINEASTDRTDISKGKLDDSESVTIFVSYDKNNRNSSCTQSSHTDINIEDRDFTENENNSVEYCHSASSNTSNREYNCETNSSNFDCNYTDYNTDISNTGNYISNNTIETQDEEYEALSNCSLTKSSTYDNTNISLSRSETNVRYNVMNSNVPLQSSKHLIYEINSETNQMSMVSSIKENNIQTEYDFYDYPSSIISNENSLIVYESGASLYLKEKNIQQNSSVISTDTIASIKCEINSNQALTIDVSNTDCKSQSTITNYLINDSLQIINNHSLNEPYTTVSENSMSSEVYDRMMLDLLRCQSFCYLPIDAYAVRPPLDLKAFREAFYPSVATQTIADKMMDFGDGLRMEDIHSQNNS